MAENVGPLLITDEFVKDVIERVLKASYTSQQPTAQALVLLANILATVLKEHQNEWYH